MGCCISKRKKAQTLHPYSPEYQQRMFEKTREFFLREKEIICTIIDTDGERYRLFGDAINFLTLHANPENVTPNETNDVTWGYTFDFYHENAPRFTRLFYDFDLDEQFLVSDQPIETEGDTAEKPRKLRLIVKYNSLDESEIFKRNHDEGNFISEIYIVDFNSNFYDLMRSVQEFRMDMIDGKYVVRHINIFESYESNVEYRKMSQKD